MELVSHGLSLAELDADPRPSHWKRLLDAADVVQARRQLEEVDLWVNTEGASGEIREEGPAHLRTPPPKTRTILVGYQRLIARLEARAYPEQHQQRQAQAAAERLPEQRRKAASFWGAVGIDQAIRLYVEGDRVETLN